jgi:hypothetical protein
VIAWIAHAVFARAVGAVVVIARIAVAVLG